jgi:hexulose-6-phosphate isomerase
MQGRLVPPSEPSRIQSFPRESWPAEFALAAQARFGCIEWIYDSHGRDVNPIGSDDGIAIMKDLQRKSGVAVESVVADYYMEHLLTSAEQVENDLEWLLSRCELAGIRRVVLPFVDASSVRHPARRDDAARVVSNATRAAEENGVELHLETDLPPTEFAEFLAAIDHPLVRVNYDSGNSASLGFDVREEFAAYGERVGSVHLKDRVHGGGTVALGTGDADFSALFDELARMKYSGDLILQVARGTSGREPEWADANRRFFEPYIDKFLT